MPVGCRYWTNTLAHRSPNPSAAQATSWEETYREIYEGYRSELMARTHLKPLYDKLVYVWDDETEDIQLDTSALVAALLSRAWPRILKKESNFYPSLPGLVVAWDTLAEELFPLPSVRPSSRWTPSLAGYLTRAGCP